MSLFFKLTLFVHQHLLELLVSQAYPPLPVDQVAAFLISLVVPSVHVFPLILIKQRSNLSPSLSLSLFLSFSFSLSLSLSLSPSLPLSLFLPPSLSLFLSLSLPPSLPLSLSPSLPPSLSFSLPPSLSLFLSLYPSVRNTTNLVELKTLFLQFSMVFECFSYFTLELKGKTCAHIKTRCQLAGQTDKHTQQPHGHNSTCHSLQHWNNKMSTHCQCGFCYTVWSCLAYLVQLPSNH